MYLQLAANQKAVHIVKAESNSKNPYSIFNLSALEGAMKKLNPNAFKLWAYLNANQNNYEFGLSNKALKEATGMCKNTYYAAVNELIDKEYLVKVELRENLPGYLFFE